MMSRLSQWYFTCKLAFTNSQTLLAEADETVLALQAEVSATQARWQATRVRLSLA